VLTGAPSLVIPSRNDKQGGPKMAETKDSASAEPQNEEERRAKLLKTGIGIGIGSAAIVAALLYANQSRRSKRKT
jgi:hypothetical protein